MWYCKYVQLYTCNRIQLYMHLRRDLLHELCTCMDATAHITSTILTLQSRTSKNLISECAKWLEEWVLSFGIFGEFSGRLVSESAIDPNIRLLVVNRRYVDCLTVRFDVFGSLIVSEVMKQWTWNNHNAEVMPWQGMESWILRVIRNGDSGTSSETVWQIIISIDHIYDHVYLNGGA